MKAKKAIQGSIWLPVTISIVAIIIIALVVIVVSNTIRKNDQNIVCNATNLTVPSQALVVVTFDTWGQSTTSNNQVVFDYWLNNYGSQEADNVYVKCVIIDDNGRPFKSVEENAGNIASYSTNYESLDLNNYQLPINDLNMSGGCYPERCTNCVMLDRQIQSLNASFNQYDSELAGTVQ